MDKKFNSKLALPIIELALHEDIGSGDVTSALLNKNRIATAEIIAKESAVIAGLPVIKEVYKRISKKIKISFKIKEGDFVKPLTQVATITGAVPDLLTGERTILNLLSILSGIATTTKNFADAVKGTKCKVYDTRKTIPGLRYLSKYAVTVGGGENHRMGLYDMVLIKDNHIAASGITTSIVNARKQFPKLPIMVEVENKNQFLEALTHLPEFILLDNMSLAEMAHCVKLAKKSGSKRPLLEASGGVNLSSVRAIAKTGVDRISIGALTHSYKSIDLSMEIVHKANN